MKIEIGPGKERINKDWIGFGPVKTNSVDIVGVWGQDKLPFEDNSVSLFYASHVLEHVWWYQSEFALAEIYRCLKKEGSIEIWVPDLYYLFQNYQTKTCGDKWRKHNKESNFMKWLNGRLFAYGDFNNLHKSCWDKNYLIEVLQKSGFEYIFDLKKPRSTNHGKINLGIGAIK